MLEGKIVSANRGLDTGRPAILIFRTAALGDFILSIPGFRAVRKHFPLHRIVLLTTPSAHASNKLAVKKYLKTDYFEWLDLLPEGIIDTVIPVGSAHSLSEIRRLRGELANLQIDKIICMVDVGHPLIRRILKYLFLKMLSFRAPVLGLSGKGFRFFGNERRLRAKGYLPHHVYGPMQFTEDLDLGLVTDQEISTRIRVPSNNIRFIRDLLERLNLTESRCVCLSFGASKYHKKWPLQNFIALIWSILQEYPQFNIILTGVPADHPEASEIQSLDGRIVSLVGLFDTQQLAALFHVVGFVICNDGGAAHLADAAGATVVTIVPGIELEDSIEPYNNRPFAIRSFPKCYPCYDFQRCPTGTLGCLTRIGPEAVFEVFKKAMEFRRSSINNLCA